MPETSDLSMTRRSMIAATVGAATLGRTPALAQTRKTFVLVHGAWHGGWCWRRVADTLEGKGHKVYTPTLTGVGDPWRTLDAPATSGHDVMVDAPDWLADVLLQVS